MTNVAEPILQAQELAGGKKCLLVEGRDQRKSTGCAVSISPMATEWGAQLQPRRICSVTPGPIS